MKFRPCIDLHQGKVKQIVGSTLSDSSDRSPKTNFTSEKPAHWYASLYREDNLTGGHIIQLGPGNKAAARSALAAWPGKLQIGGGITGDNAKEWIDAGAEAVIVTSWVFHDGSVDEDRLNTLSSLVGRERLVLDLSCRKRGDDYYVVTDRWQKFTDEVVGPELLTRLAGYCSEYLIHAVDVEGMCNGIETPLVEILGSWGEIPITYAGGIKSMEDIEDISRIGGGNIDFTVGSALDIFGGNMLEYSELSQKFHGV